MVFYSGGGVYKHKPTTRLQEKADNRYFKKRYIEKMKVREKELLNRRDYDL